MARDYVENMPRGRNSQTEWWLTSIAGSDVPYLQQMKEQSVQSSRKYESSHVIYRVEILCQASITPETEIMLDIQLLIHG